MNHRGSTFLSGCAPLDSVVFFAKEADEPAANGERNASFFIFNENDKEAAFKKYQRDVAWTAQAIATVKPASTGKRDVVAISDRGDFWEVEAATATEHVGRIDVVRGAVRSLAVVGDTVYGCGMARMVLMREGRGRWRELGPHDSAASAIVGFEDLDGFGDDELYTVGWNGEIWRFSDRRWHQIDSPVSSLLSAVCCGDDGQVRAVGHDGAMVQGRGDVWKAVETGRREQLLDVTTYKGEVYVVSNDAIFKLTSDGLVPDPDFADGERPSTCLHLLRAPDALVSMGTKDLWRKKDGVWKRLV